MELGEKLRQARMEAGLSQRQLCGEEITRNMLSLIENGAAKPSMKTLQYLASKLGKSVSYFLEETAVLSPNQALMAEVRELFDTGNYPEADKMLASYRSPDPVYDREKEILWVLIRLELAREAIRQDRYLYAREILTQTPVDTTYLSEELLRKKLLLLGSVAETTVSDQLPCIDEELMLRARDAFGRRDFLKASHLLESMEQQNSPRWHLLRGSVALELKQWDVAADYLRNAEDALPRETCPLLEICYRELGDFRKAYEYACRQR